MNEVEQAWTRYECAFKEWQSIYLNAQARVPGPEVDPQVQAARVRRDVLLYDYYMASDREASAA